jgi:UDP-2,3-diacylglucosamine pyrophosphatase LpxH
MKKTIIIPSAIIAVLAISFLVFWVSYSNKTNTVTQEIDPFNNGVVQRNLIVAISDIHLGADLAYAEINKNVDMLEKFLKRISISNNVKELVINGDMLDEWFVPADIDTYQGKDQADFVKRIAKTNQGIIDTLNYIIQDKKILVTYVPGNHDLTITRENVESILPGINQKRDKEQGLGTYSPNDYPQIAFEHGHRYNFFCAPDPISNQNVASGTILPPGYFYTRIAALHVVQKNPKPADTPPIVTPNISGDESQDLMFEYWNIWNRSLIKFTIKNKFNEKIIKTNIDKFTKTYSVNDILPYQKIAGGFIDVNLYKKIQDTWDKRQKLNHVAVNIPITEAIMNAANASETDDQAKTQYFLNSDSDKRLVIFGHTHDAKIIASTDHNGQKAIYANTGTWIDDNTAANTTMNFVVITLQSPDPASQTLVRLYNFENGRVTKMAEDSLRF